MELNERNPHGFTKEELRRQKKGVGARRAIGKKYFTMPDIHRMGAALERRALKARKRAAAAERTTHTRSHDGR